MVGLTVSHYRIGERLGAGGMGVVYRAEDTRLLRPVAVKFLGQGASDDPALARFMQEARTASSLNHPNICTVYDVGEFEGRPYLVMEFLEGRTLKERLADETLTEQEIVEVALPVAEALRAAHEKGIIHRDIKPANIFLADDGSVKLVDFGIAKAAFPDARVQDAPTELTAGGAIPGTVTYMSPEQALGRALDSRSDLFSLGVVLYEMAYGSNPFQDDTAVATIDAILHRKPEFPVLAQSKPSKGLRKTIGRLLEKEPRRRYQTASDLILELRKVQTGKPSPRALPLGVAAVVAFAAILLVSVWISRSPGFFGKPAPAPANKMEDSTQRPIVAVLRLSGPATDASTSEIGFGVSYTLATSLASIRSVTMIPPSSTLGGDAADRQPQEIARQLGATYIVTGALQKSGDKLWVNLNLLKGNTVVWGGDTVGDLNDLFDLQQKLISKLTNALQLALSDDDRRRLRAPPTRNKDAYADYLQARSFLERADQPKNLDRSIRLFQAAVEKDPDFSLAHAGLGEAFWVRYERNKEVEWTVRARREVESALRLDPEQAGVRRSLARIYVGTGQNDKAIEELHRAAELEPNSDETQRLLGEVLDTQGKTADAIEAFRRAIALRPDFWGNHRALGLAYFKKGRYREAVAAFTRVTELQPDLPLGFHYLGVTYHAMGQLENAKRNYRKAIELGPSAGAYANLGTILYREGDFGAAAQYYKESLKIAPKSVVNLRNLGDVYRRMGARSQAEAAYIQALELVRDQLGVNPADAWLLSFEALIEAKLGRRQEASRHADQALRIAPRDGEVRYRRAVVHALAGEEDAAIRELEIALAAGYSDREASVDDDLAALRKRPDFPVLLKKNP